MGSKLVDPSNHMTPHNTKNLLIASRATNCVGILTKGLKLHLQGRMFSAQILRDVNKVRQKFNLPNGTIKEIFIVASAFTRPLENVKSFFRFFRATAALRN